MSTAPDLDCRAVVVRGKGEACLESLPIESPGPGEVLLRMRCCGLCGTDLFKINQDPPPIGKVLGHELVGSVVAMGDGVDSFALGDRVVTPHHVPCGSCHLCLLDSPTLCEVFREDLIAPGGFSEFFVVGHRAVQSAARRVPPGMADEIAMFLEPAACVLRSIDRAALPEPERSSGRGLTALILGAGSMGLLHLLVLRSLYADLRIVVSDPLAERRELAMRLGAAAAGSPDQLGGIVAATSCELGADCVFDTVGQPAALRSAIEMTREGATAVLFAHARAGEELIVELNALFKSERRLVGTYSGGPAEQEAVWQLLIDGRLDPSPLISHRLPLSRFQEGVDLTLNHRALKVMILPDEEVGSAAS